MSDIFEKLDGIGAETDAALERFMDDEEMYLKYVSKFPEEPTMASIKSAVDAKDYAAAEKAVHALKGIVNNLGFLTLADEVIDMLEELRDDNIPDALEAYEHVKEQYAIYCDTIKAWRDSNG